MLWSAADYKMPPNQEPALSEQFENHLVSMTQENSELRPTMSDVLQVNLIVPYLIQRNHRRENAP